MNKKKINKHGNKDIQEETNDRITSYKKWLRTCKTDIGYPIDVDMIHWVVVNNTPHPAVITEITCANEWVMINNKYKMSLVYRFFLRDIQGRAITQLQKTLNIPAYVILYKEPISEVHVFCLEKNIWTVYNSLSDWEKQLNRVINNVKLNL